MDHMNQSFCPYCQSNKVRFPWLHKRAGFFGSAGFPLILFLGMGWVATNVGLRGKAEWAANLVGCFFCVWFIVRLADTFPNRS